MKIVSVDEDCNIEYEDGSWEICKYRPPMVFQECEPGYGSHGECPKYNYYHPTISKTSGEKGMNCAECGQPLILDEEKRHGACNACYGLAVCPEALQEWNTPEEDEAWKDL